jgi:hypothetical protein
MYLPPCPSSLRPCIGRLVLFAGAALSSISAVAQEPAPARAQCGGLFVEESGDKFVLYPDGRWQRESVQVVLDFDDAFTEAFRTQALVAAADATATWNDALCDGLSLIAPAEAAQLEAGGQVPEGQIRISVVTDALNSSSGRRLFGFTANRSLDGSYLSSRIFVDGANWSWSEDNLCSSAPDMVGVLTHELGHALGIDHSAEPTAVMRGRADAEETRWLRVLRDDDLQALAARYGCSNGATASDEIVCEDCSSCAGVCAATNAGPRCLPACLEVEQSCPGGTCALVYDVDVEPAECALACIPDADPCSVVEEEPPDTGCGMAGRSSSPSLALILAGCVLLGRRRRISCPRPDRAGA